MSKYTDAIQQLDHSLNFVSVSSPEWIKTKAAMAALDQAEMAEATNDFVLASRRLDDAMAKLQAVLAGIRPDPAPHFLERVNNALETLQPVARNVDALLSGEPASALPGMQATNQATFPSTTEPIVPPLREVSRAAASRGQDVAQMIDAILRREGGFVNHVNDRGGATNFGITQRTLSAWRGAAVSVDDVRGLTIDEARQIYEANYFKRPKIDQLPALIQPLMFDMCINHGPATAVKLLQQLLDDSGHRGYMTEALEALRATPLTIWASTGSKLTPIRGTWRRPECSRSSGSREKVCSASAGSPTGRSRIAPCTACCAATGLLESVRQEDSEPGEAGAGPLLPPVVPHRLVVTKPGPRRHRKRQRWGRPWHECERFPAGNLGPSRAPAAVGPTS